MGKNTEVEVGFFLLDMIAALIQSDPTLENSQSEVCPKARLRRSRDSNAGGRRYGKDFYYIIR
jgi:hypothetical protein